MKKVLLFVIVLILSQCQISIETKNTYAGTTLGPPGLESKAVLLDGMTYRVFTYTNYMHGGSAIFVTNVT